MISFHTYVRGRCTECKRREPWIAPDGSEHETRAMAALAGWSRPQLRRPTMSKGAALLRRQADNRG